ncbi:MAG: 4Fe-4S binding protein [Deltaproteobacteria bacterium]|nr:4Fe-4S binding protein [Deltaproteobacteria bacterium]
MNVRTVKLVYFSPTGTTKKILEGIAKGLEAEVVEHVDLTLPKAIDASYPEMWDELVLFGVPVYAGRLPKTSIPRLRRLKGHNTPAVTVVLYGNRAFEDALVELGDLVMELGFFPVAGGAFIGEHSFANENRPIASGRPDDQDLVAAKEFGSRIRAKMSGMGLSDGAPSVKFPGNVPYIERDRSIMADKSARTREEICTLCGTCAPLCPVAAITIDEAVKTDNFACILCHACVKSCPTGARVVDDSHINRLREWLNDNCQARQEPEIFL